MEKTTLSLPPYRLPSHAYLFLLSFTPQGEIELLHKNEETPSISLSPSEKLTNDGKIYEFLWKRGKLSQSKEYSLGIDTKDFTQIAKIHQTLTDLLTVLPTKKEEEALKSLIETLNSFEIKETTLQTPLISIIIYEVVFALHGIGVDGGIGVGVGLDRALDTPAISNHIIKFTNDIQSTKLFQSFLLKPENLLRKISHIVQNPLEVIKNKIQENLPTIIDFAGVNSALYTYRNEADQSVYWDHIPLSGFPTFQVKKQEIEKLREKSIVWNKLFNRMVRRISIFEKVFEELSQVDMFVNKLWKISQRKKENLKSHGLEFCIFRNDYLRDGALEQWKQVEFNAIAASFGYMSDSIQKLHHVVYNQIFSDFTQGKQLACLPDASVLLADGLSHAHILYGKPKKSKILFVVGTNEGNILDQRGLELLLGYRGVLVIRKTFEEIIKEIKINKEDNALFIGEQEISVVYFRHGYIPNHYVDEEHWKVRERMEMSTAIKCPSVEFQLVNFKKIQEVLQRKDILSQLLDTEDEIEKVKEDFVQIWSLDSSNEQSAALELVKAKPDDYVLKPQREGGGNNTYGLEIIEKFKSKHASAELKAFILMKRIKPTPRAGFLVKKRQLNVCGVISELGLYSYLISDDKKMIESKYGGYLLRTKHFETDEGGVATGYSVLDSLVYDESEKDGDKL